MQPFATYHGACTSRLLGASAPARAQVMRLLCRPNKPAIHLRFLRHHSDNVLRPRVIKTMAIFPQLDLVIGEKARCKRIGKTIHVVHISNDRQIAPTITKNGPALRRAVLLGSGSPCPKYHDSRPQRFRLATTRRSPGLFRRPTDSRVTNTCLGSRARKTPCSGGFADQEADDRHPTGAGDERVCHLV